MALVPWRGHTRHPEESAVSGGLPAASEHAGDAAEIALLFESAAEGSDLPVRLYRRLHLLVERSVPARGIEAAPVPRAARVRFADGTTVVAKTSVPGELGLLALAIRRASVTPRACYMGADDQVRIVLVGRPNGHPVSLQVVGFDQPD